MAGGLARLLGTDGSRVSSITDRIGMGMNQVASAGGAHPGYAARQQLPNHLQMLNPEALQAIIQRFRPTAGVQYQ